MEISPLPAAPTHPSWPDECVEPDTDSAGSLCTIHSDAGVGVSLWSLPSSRVATSPNLAVQLRLAPDAPVIIGRKDGGEIEYLDPRYAPTPIVPGTGETILKHGGRAEDNYVSRGHFMLRSHAAGILFVNGVPSRGGGIRPPRNWTQLLLPDDRRLAPGEQILIERGAAIAIKLPNDTRLTIEAG